MEWNAYCAPRFDDVAADELLDELAEVGPPEPLAALGPGGVTAPQRAPPAEYLNASISGGLSVGSAGWGCRPWAFP